MLEFRLDGGQVAVSGDEPWYDTKDGIAEAVLTLAGFNRLISERSAAHYERRENLHEFMVFGRYMFDTCGNCAKASDRVPKLLCPDIPDVMTRDEFLAYWETSGQGGMLSFSYGGDVPRADLTCPWCGQGWTIENCHDTVVHHTTEVFSLTEFEYLTLGFVKDQYRVKTEAIYRMQSDILIRHDRFIDLSPKYPGSDKDWEKKILKNETGWVGVRDGITDDYVIQPGDEGRFNVWKFFHHECNRLHLRDVTERRFLELFKAAGFQDNRLTAMPNQYCPCDHCTPWFDVNTEFGTIQIGWRKRVLHIDWSAMADRLAACGELPTIRFVDLFKDEDVTKGSDFIHAWGYEKAQDYLGRIYRLLSESKK
jgi:hypothetical protein